MRNLITSAMFAMFFTCAVQAQETIPSSGGEAKGVGGGHYWSSTVSGSGSRSFRYDNSAAMYNDLRAKGYSVRCIKD